MRAGLDGILQRVPVEVGQQVAPGTNLARVANPGRLKAEIKIAETQAKDIQIGQKVAHRHAHRHRRRHRRRASIRRCRTARSPWTSASSAICRRGAVPISAWTAPSSSSGWRTSSTWAVRRSAQEQSAVGLFKVASDGSARRVQVKIGRISVNAVEVLSGLNVGDQVVLSDMSTWDAFDRVRLQ